MNIKLVDLLRYKREVELKHRGKTLSKVWIRIIGDSDLQESIRLGRVASAAIRRTLKDPESLDYKAEILPVYDAPIEDCITVIVQSESRQFQAEAEANVERPDLPEIEEFAVDPDAATLEEQEKLDLAVIKTAKDYEAAKKEYSDTRVEVLRAELAGLPEIEVRKRAEQETVNSIALTTFLLEVQNEKIWRAVYTDKACTERAYSSRAEYQDTNENLRNQLFEAYTDLEVNGEDIKN